MKIIGLKEDTQILDISRKRLRFTHEKMGSAGEGACGFSRPQGTRSWQDFFVEMKGSEVD